MIRFDEVTFLKLSGMKLGEYVEQYIAKDFRDLDQDTALSLLQRIEDLDEEHAMHAIQFGVYLNVAGISAIAVNFLNRGVPWHGPQAEVIKYLHDAQDLSVEHVNKITRRRNKKWNDLTFPNVFPQLLDELRTTASKRTKR